MAALSGLPGAGRVVMFNCQHDRRAPERQEPNRAGRGADPFGRPGKPRSAPAFAFERNAGMTFSRLDRVVPTGKKGTRMREGAELMCNTRRGEDIEYEALRLAEKQAYKKEQTRQERESREKKPLTKKIKEMVGVR